MVKKLSNIALFVFGVVIIMVFAVVGPIVSIIFTDFRVPTNSEVERLVGFGSCAFPVIAICVLGGTFYVLHGIGDGQSSWETFEDAEREKGQPHDQAEEADKALSKNKGVVVGRVSRGGVHRGRLAHKVIPHQEQKGAVRRVGR